MPQITPLRNAEPPAPGRFRIGVGAGFAGDRYEPAEVLAQFGSLDALAFECLAERTIGLAQQRKASAGEPGFDQRILRRLATTLPILLPGSTVVTTNAGAADPHAAAIAVRDLIDREGLPRVPIGIVTGDDVLANLDLRSSRVLGTDDTLWDLRDRLVSANAYIGAAPVVEALDDGARIVITGRTSDAALFLGPIAHHHGWRLDALDRVAAGTLVGHLLECAGQLTGGYFADGATKHVPGLAQLGFPFADVASDGSAVYRKVPGTGGVLDRRTVLEQLLYEIDNPFAYVTPDVTLDLSSVSIAETGENEVTVGGGVPRGVPDQLKVSVGVLDGFIAVAEIGYAGAGCLRRGELAADIIRDRWAAVHGLDRDDVTIGYVGYNAHRPWWQGDGSEPPEIRVRFSVRTWQRDVAVALGEEVEALYTNGPFGGGGVTHSVKETVGIVSTLIPRDRVEAKFVTIS